MSFPTHCPTCRHSTQPIAGSERHCGWGLAVIERCPSCGSWLLDPDGIDAIELDATPADLTPPPVEPSPTVKHVVRTKFLGFDSRPDGLDEFFYPRHMTGRAS